MSSSPDTVDIVVVGGDSAGCVVAGRLSEDPTTSVALLEAGGDTNDWLVNTPAALFLMVASPIHNWHFQTVAQPGLNGRQGYQPRGKGLGGSSAINAMVYIRGHRSDYDNWAALGNPGWSYEEVLPYFRRSEDNNQFAAPYHGVGGPLGVSESQSDNPLRQVWLQAAREADFPLTEDFNGETQEGVGLYQATARNGERCSAARAYIYPILKDRPNLRVETYAHATQIVFEGKRAVGVAYRRAGEIRQLRARREVIISAGVFQTPQLLLLSGIGQPEALRRLGIAVLHELPGVGRNLMDAPALRSLRKHDLFTEHVASDDQIRSVLRQRVDTVYHPACSCPMGPDRSVAVVDSRLRVHGLAGLRIVDASVMPRVVRGNTNAPTIMIAEKAVDMIRTDRPS